MHCKECGTKYASDDTNFCLNCGVKKGNGHQYCQNCGEARKSINQEVCLSCGSEFKTIAGGSTKIKLVVLLLWFFLGGFGAHHFYAGRMGKGAIYAALFVINLFFGWLIFGLLYIPIAILLIVDLVQILTNKFKDGDGNPILNWT